MGADSVRAIANSIQEMSSLRLMSAVRQIASSRFHAASIQTADVSKRPDLPRRPEILRVSVTGMENLRWHGQLRIDWETALWSGSVGHAATHRHFAAQAVFSSGQLRVIGDDGEEVSGNCLLIEPNARHLLLPADDALIWYIEPTAAFGPSDALRARIDASDVRIVSGRDARLFWADWTERRARPTVDARVSRAIRKIECLLPVGAVRLADVCAAGDLSTGRFRHLFAAEIGLPFQRFVLWRRLAAAFEGLLAGATVTEAAHAAGFADAAHFARTIKAMFGIRASDILLER
ncbi:helix-turn-helix domain-containing protein [Sphingopyxis sp.]|uniref:helix-turn-helix domain-containing protein n=1 Tax=Sphingopyxis sp. TaxID=1908224 RepID=UPI0035B34510